MLEATMSKRRIFEIYLNVVEWGENVFGADAACALLLRRHRRHTRFGGRARLAAMLPRPRYYDRNRESPYLTNYSDSILLADGRRPDSLGGARLRGPTKSAAIGGLGLDFSIATT